MMTPPIAAALLPIAKQPVHSPALISPVLAYAPGRATTARQARPAPASGATVLQRFVTKAGAMSPQLRESFAAFDGAPVHSWITEESAMSALAGLALQQQAPIWLYLVGLASHAKVLEHPDTASAQAAVTAVQTLVEHQWWVVECMDGRRPDRAQRLAQRCRQRAHFATGICAAMLALAPRGERGPHHWWAGQASDIQGGAVEFLALTAYARNPKTTANEVEEQLSWAVEVCGRLVVDSLSRMMRVERSQCAQRAA